MNKPIFIESIKVLNGEFYNLPLHLERMNRTSLAFFNIFVPVNLEEESIPDEYRTGLVKCRVAYSDKVLNIAYERYSFRSITSLALVEDNSIDYNYKSADRSSLNHLLEAKGNCNDILIIKNGYVTDTSYTNVIFENETGLYTPSTFLLPGIKRQYLLNNNIITETEIKKQDIDKYTKIFLINSMIDLEDNICIEISDIKR